jgi:hypothetical protein
MGQTIQIWDANVVAEMLLVSTDRSLTGQDGETYTPDDSISSDSIFPAQLAARLFQSDPSIDHVYVMSNVLSIRRPGGWDETSIASTREVVANFFLFYGAESPSVTDSSVDSEVPSSEEEA